MPNKIYLYLIICCFQYLSAQTDVSGTINTSTWSASNSPYIVTGNILVNSGETLTIEPGVTVQFDSDTYLKVEGALYAVGTSSSYITFQSNAASPDKSDWKGIRIRSTGGSTIDGSQNYSSGSQLKYVKIKHADRGLYIHDTGFHLSYSELSTNNMAIEIDSSIC